MGRKVAKPIPWYGIYIGTVTPSVFRCIPVYIAVDCEGCVTIKFWRHENAGLSFIESDSNHSHSH